MKDDHQSVLIEGGMDRAIHDWLAANLGQVVGFRRHARWRIGWDAEVQASGKRKALYIRGPRGNNYVSPIDMAQEAAIHRAYLANGIPAPKPIAVIDDPCSLVLERLPGTINTETIPDPAVRQRVREEFIEIIARQHRIPLDQFAEVGLDIPVGADSVSRNLYAASEVIFFKLISRPWPLMRFVGRWLKRHVPLDRTRAAFINGDAGQFMFDGDRISGLIDFEMSAFGDPAAELAGMRLRDTSEPLGNLSTLYDHYEAITGDRISKTLIEYHTAGFCGVNGFMLWPLAFSSTREQDYMAYMQFAVATSRWCITAMAEHAGITLTEPPRPQACPMGFEHAGVHLVRQIGELPATDENVAYGRDSAAALAQYQHRWLTYGASVVEADLADCETLTGYRPKNQDELARLVEDYVLQDHANDDARLIQHFHNWLRRQDFLLTGCGVASSFVGLDLQAIPAR